MTKPTGSRLYRMLLAILPRAFRARWGAEMEHVFEDRLRVAGSSRIRRTWVVMRATLDLALLAVGDRARMRSAGREDNDEGAGLSQAVQDLRYVARTLRRSPAFTISAVATLMIGIGASTATFSVVHAVLLRDLPYEDSERLVVVWPEVNATKSLAIMAEDRMASLERVTGLSDWSLTLTGAGEPIELTGTLVSPHHFEVMGVRPLMGRTFEPVEGLPGRAGVVVLSHGLWVRAFGADPEILGRTIELAGAEYDRRLVIGVMPAHYEPVGSETQVWIPLEGDPAVAPEQDETWYVNTRIARLAESATLAQASSEVRDYAAMARQRLPDHYDEDDVAGATVQTLRDFRAGRLGRALWVALGAVALVLLISCANLANLLLARGEARSHDLSMRVALGAGRGRIVRLLALETAALGLVGGVLGVVCAYGLLALLVAWAPGDFPGLAQIGVRGPMLASALGATLISTGLAGLVPVRAAARAGAAGSLVGKTRGASTVRAGARIGPALVVAQMASAVVVTAGSGLMLRSLGALMAVDPGLDASAVLTFRPTPPAGRYPDGLAFRDYYDRITARVASLPGVESVGAIHILPGSDGNWSFPTFPEGVDQPEGVPTPTVNFRATRSGYFDVVRIPLLEGRSLSVADGPDSESVVLVNQAFVRRFWPGLDPIGRHVRIFSPTGDPARVVGVVGDVRQHGYALEPRPEMYYPHAQVPWDQVSMWMTVRVASGEPLDYAAAIREAVWAVDDDVPITGMQELADVVGRSTETTRFLTLLLVGFGLVALLLGGVGVYGVTAFTVGRRVPEFGVRVALGSSRAGLLGASLRRSLAPVGLGVVLGVGGALTMSRFLESALYGVGTRDPATMVGVPVLLTAVAIAASLVPAWRASRVDAVEVLNTE